MSTEEKGNFEDMANADKETYIPPKGEIKTKSKNPDVPQRLPWVFFLLIIAPRSKENILAYALVMYWERHGVTLL